MSHCFARRRQTLHGGEIEQLVLQNLIRRICAVNHQPFAVVPDNRRAPQSCQDANLDFLRAERDKFVKTGGKTFERFARQPDDQICVDVDTGFAAEIIKIIRKPFVILATADRCAELRD